MPIRAPTLRKPDISNTIQTMRAHAVLLCLTVSACVNNVALPDADEGSTGAPQPNGSTSTGTRPPATTTGLATTETSAPGTASDDGSTSQEDSTSSPTADSTDGTDTGEFECSTYDQDCPPGEKCNPVGIDGAPTWNGTACVPVDPRPDAPGEPCTVTDSPYSGLDSCDAGAICWRVDPETKVGTCRSHCSGTDAMPICPEPGQFCSASGSGPIALCFDECDPLDPDACPPGDGCYLVSPSRFICELDSSGDGGGQLDACSFITECDPGFICLGAFTIDACEAESCCTAFCDPAAPDCPAPTECVPLFEKGARTLYGDVGACIQNSG